MILNCHVKLAVKTKTNKKQVVCLICMSWSADHLRHSRVWQHIVAVISSTKWGEKTKQKNNATFSASSVLALWEVNSVQFIHIKDPHTTAATTYREHWEAANPLNSAFPVTHTSLIRSTHRWPQHKSSWSHKPQLKARGMQDQNYRQQEHSQKHFYTQIDPLFP